MIRHLGVFVGLVLGFNTSLGLAQDGQPPISNSTPPIIQKNELSDNGMIAAVKAIRKQLGGGIAEQFKDLGKDGSSSQEAERDFDRELNRLATQAARNSEFGSSALIIPHPKIRIPTPAPPPSFGYPNRSDRHYLQNTPFQKAVPIGYSGKRVATTDLLRDAARRLDSMAADLEAANLYQEADEIREQARKFWLKARGMKNNSN